MSRERMLPEEFADLEPFAPTWCLASEPERYRTRLASTMEQMTAFYDAAFPRVRDAMKYLDQFPLDDLTTEQLNLLHLVYALITVSLPVEVWGQPRTIDSGNAYFERQVEPTP
jgi:hypothetical protein